MNEQDFIKALARYEAHETPENILRDFPGHEDELRSLFGVAKLLTSSRDMISLREGSFDRIKRNVTQKAQLGYTGERDRSGRLLRNPLLIIMNKTKVLLPLGVLAVLVIVFISMKGTPNTTEDESSKLMQNSAMVSDDDLAFDANLLGAEESNFDLTELEAILSEESEVNASLTTL
ncbi:MAG: hypothetical protein AAB407_02425 [Patescibacteria group bacterium]